LRAFEDGYNDDATESDAGFEAAYAPPEVAVRLGGRLLPGRV
jgi:hypothetical protein